ncbi:MAG: hypothetical protein IRZ16_13950 [Myxococcaceae bacterium]|nr:hypothetical protein [Myxococcaceae bacterium]
MKRLSGLFFGVVMAALFVGTPVMAEDGHDHADAAARRYRNQLPFQLPSEGKPEPKTCAGRCQRDKTDCEAMCKVVGNSQGAAACKKACTDVEKDCQDSCKAEGMP